ncbi:MAG: twin-arginine translocation signal domain-containing protein [Campylobacter sp.]|nr:twin-arginine translocation signal domain-containing protein [Campylobacter sp.]
MKQDRREFLKKSLKVTTIAGAAVAATSLAGASKTASEVDDNGVVIGKSNKKEVLYKKTQSWEQYYKVAY